MTKYFGFAFSVAMLPKGKVFVQKFDLTLDEVKRFLSEEYTSCLNPSHKATIEAAKSRFDLEIAIPEQPPRVALQDGDELVIMQVSGLPRLTDRHEYTSEEIAKANFSFVSIVVHTPADR